MTEHLLPMHPHCGTDCLVTSKIALLNNYLRNSWRTILPAVVLSLSDVDYIYLPYSKSNMENCPFAKDALCCHSLTKDIVHYFFPFASSIHLALVLPRGVVATPLRFPRSLQKRWRKCPRASKYNSFTTFAIILMEKVGVPPYPGITACILILL